MTPRSRHFLKLILTSIACVLLAGGAQAQEETDGTILTTTCLGCHGIATYKNTYPTYHVPRLAGQNAQYLVDALRAYRDGQRPHSTMHAQASTLSDAQMQVVAEYFAAQKTLEPREPESAPEKVQQVCVACHNKSGVSALPMYPHLAGQHADYLAEALRQYWKGERKNPIMAGIILQLGEDLDKDMIRQLADWYAAQPGLATAE